MDYSPTISPSTSLSSLSSSLSTSSSHYFPLSDPTSHCHICQEPFLSSEPPLTLPCNHTFGLTCLTQWLDTSPTCPLCRRSPFSPTSTTTPKHHSPSPSTFTLSIASATDFAISMNGTTWTSIPSAVDGLTSYSINALTLPTKNGGGVGEMEGIWTRGGGKTSYGHIVDKGLQLQRNAFLYRSRSARSGALERELSGELAAEFERARVRNRAEVRWAFQTAVTRMIWLAIMEVKMLGLGMEGWRAKERVDVAMRMCRGDLESMVLEGGGEGRGEVRVAAQCMPRLFTALCVCKITEERFKEVIVVPQDVEELKVMDLTEEGELSGRKRASRQARRDPVRKAAKAALKDFVARWGVSGDHVRDFL